MRKLGIFLIGASLSLCFTFGATNGVTKASAEETETNVVYVGGMSAGFTLKTGGAQVIGTCEVVTENGSRSPASSAGVRAGDTIYKISGVRIETVAQLNEVIEKSGGKRLNAEIYRQNEEISLEITPEKDKITGKYRLGVLVRDNVSGIGTVTYIKKDGRFGSLGHAVTGENRIKMGISDGVVYSCSIVGVHKGVRGKAGELRGMFLNDKKLGNADKLSDCGIFGQVSNEFDFSRLSSVYADSNSAQMGEAYIYSTVNGVTPKRYKIEIVKVDKNNRENKNYVIKIADDGLIDETGGIVQGMSGSPILQNGKLIGAVTHVFLNDPTRGYGIDIDKMLCE